MMPTLFGQEVSDHTYELNRHMLTPPKEPKTQARKDLDAELKAQFARRFEANWALCGGPVLEKEFQFCQGRKWAVDYRTGQWLIELEGGVYTKGRHTRPGGFIEDIFKYNTAAILGYRLIRIGTGMDNIDYLHQLIAAITAPTLQQP